MWHDPENLEPYVSTHQPYTPGDRGRGNGADPDQGQQQHPDLHPHTVDPNFSVFTGGDKEIDEPPFAGDPDSEKPSWARGILTRGNKGRGKRAHDDFDDLDDLDLDDLDDDIDFEPTKKAKRPPRRKGVSLATRYGGDRRKVALIAGTVGVFAITAVAGLATAASRPSAQEVADMIEAGSAAQHNNFPAGEAVMWAGQVARVWGTWDENDPSQREVLLAQYLSQGLDSQGGWNEEGTQQVIYSVVNPEPKIMDANHALISSALQIEDGTWRCYTIPVFAYHPEQETGDAPWAFALSSAPTPSACGPRTGAPTLLANTSESGKEDQDAAADLKNNYLAGFFAAWATSDAAALKQYTASGVTVVGLGGAYQASPPPKIDDVKIPAPPDGKVEPGRDYVATVPVSWTASGSKAQITATYTVPLRRDGEQWFVTGEPQAAAQSEDAQGGAPAGIEGTSQGGATSGKGAYDTPTQPTPVSGQGTPGGQ